MMETSPTMAPLLLRNLITSLFMFADKSLLSLSRKFRLLEFLRHLLASFFLFFLHVLPPSLLFSARDNQPLKPHKNTIHHAPSRTSAASVGGGDDSAIERALTQLLAAVNDIPVSSRKYDVVRSLAESVIDDNIRENFESLRQVNRRALSAALERTLSQLEAAVMELEPGCGNYGPGSVDFYNYLIRFVLRAMKYVGDSAWSRVAKPQREEEEMSSSVISSAEKLAAEVLWLGQKLVACGYSEEAVAMWASASNLAWLGILTQPRLQGSLVRVSGIIYH